MSHARLASCASGDELFETPTKARARRDVVGIDLESATDACVVAVMVTWNRRSDVSRVLGRLSALAATRDALHVIVVDNASTDSTSAWITDEFRPECVASNASTSGIAPAFVDAHAERENTLGLASLTLITNANNLGGCGGFNTGLKRVEQAFGHPGSKQGPDFVWLLDDDIDLPEDALPRLLRAAADDPMIGLVGSRTVDLGDRQSTIESTIYYDRSSGMMGPQPGDDDGGQPSQQGARDVDIVSACSMLVRWSAIDGVGYWDDRFFIYCDDADWCLRVKRAGWRVVCALDAVVYHTPWTHKLTPVRGYYLHRNLLLMNRKHLDGNALRRVWLRWCWRLLRQAKSAALNRRMTEARLTLRSVADASAGQGGKLDAETDSRDITSGLERAGALGGNISVVVSGRAGFLMAEAFRASVTNSLIAAGRSRDLPRWTVVLPRGAERIDHGGDEPRNGALRVGLVPYVPTRLGKLRALRALLKRRPDAVVVFDGQCEFPMLFGRTTLHVSSDDLSRCTVEPGGVRQLCSFGVSWLRVAMRSIGAGLVMRRDTRSDSPSEPAA